MQVRDANQGRSDRCCDRCNATADGVDDLAVIAVVAGIDTGVDAADDFASE